MMDLLELPDLGRVPRGYTVYGETALSARAASALLDSPFGAHGAAATSPAEIIKLVLRGWLDSFTKLPAEQKPAKTLAEVFQPSVVGYDLIAAYTESNPETESEAVIITLHAKARNHNVHAIGARLRDAEQLRGLGQSALVALARAADASLPIMMPTTLARMAGGRKYLQAELKNFPRWVLDPQPLDRATLEGLANPRRTKFTGRLARAILAVDVAVAATRDVRLPKHLGVTEFPLSVTWEATLNYQSAYMRILDDWRNDREKSTAIFQFEHAKGAGRFDSQLSKFLTSIAATGPVLRAAWNLVNELRKGKKNDD